ncbi:Fic family protein [Gordonia sp. (in: high G+C Gram-positive bacteria)]|jgi:Fic family protein|uniref:Fic family protein n=2 Tax=Gordonia sp. (in: high G+C Gram-positive bacteria) TaxID=84139 RepID=UPI001DE3942B|nr:Fic family protein [Gordonia sp. (in: high G+C Gram-positive bacteria)]MCB1295740.1 Fic family protein [Gordonia sp. (in: high G+C Gram-positive bacteria)]HMS74982.1 Fic family protein [Gordonia sp. (in: high G+C Gram-positive bacteria)]HQV20198.1 Fic family protein [Gordonia sp. (in: high G+C Gram-positive bacteria)]
MDAAKFVDGAFGRPAIGVGAASFTYYRPHPIPTDIDLAPLTVLALSEADAALGLLNGLGRLIRDPEMLLGSFVRKEALASTRIEGTNASLSEVLEAEARDGGPVTDDVAEVERYLAATDLAISLTADLPITERLIRQVHAELMAGVRGQERHPGEFRRSPVWIGAAGATPNSARFVPPLPEYIGELMTDWENYVNRPSQVPTLVRAAMSHYQFETIHPFLDGNGRIGRLLVGLFLMSTGRLTRPLLYLSGYLEANRSEYYERLQGIRERAEVQEYLQFFFVAVRRQSEDAVSRAGRLVELRERYYRQVEMERSRVAALIPLIFGTPFIHARRIELSFANSGGPITTQGARNLLAKAEELGWVSRYGGLGKGSRTVYLARDVFEIIEAPTNYEQ